MLSCVWGVCGAGQKKKKINSTERMDMFWTDGTG